MKKILLALTFATLPFFVGAALLPSVKPSKVGLDEHRLLKADSAINAAIAQQTMPGAVLAVVRHGRMAYLKAYGNKQVKPTVEPMTTDVIFDMASCTKPLATAMCVMKLCEAGRIRLLDPVSMYLPGFQDWSDSDGVTTIRIQHLLTHSSGLPAYASVSTLSKEFGSPNPKALLEHIKTVDRKFCPESDFLYSCLNYITLQYIVEAVTGQSLREFVQQNIYQPLGLEHTDYLPSPDDAAPWRSRIAPTTVYDDGTMLCGQVHDPLARVMNGGISGNAGLFSDANDVALLCAMLLADGTYDGKRILSSATVRAMRTVPSFAKDLGRTYGWDVYSPYASCNGDLFSSETYGHTGFTGTSVVIDPVNDCAVILLSNAVHPTDGGSGMVRLRSVISNIVASAIY